MRRFLKNLLLFALLQLLVGGVLVARFEPDPGSYIAATLDKNELLRTAPSPRLVFVGGSDLAFGLDSRRLEEALPYHVVNMGLHGGLGLDFMLAEARAGLRPGDVAVLSIGYDLFARSGTSDMLFEALEHRPESLALLSWGDVGPLLDSAVAHFGWVVREGIRRLRGIPLRGGRPPYARRSFNEYGDLVDHWEMEPRAWHASILPDGVPRRQLSETIDKLNRFRADVAERGVRVFFTFVPIPREVFEERERDIRTVANRLSHEAAFPVILGPEEVVLPLDHFFNSVYHLSGEGSRRRTDTLITALRHHLGAAGD